MFFTILFSLMLFYYLNYYILNFTHIYLTRSLNFFVENFVFAHAVCWKLPDYPTFNSGKTKQMYQFSQIQFDGTSNFLQSNYQGSLPFRYHAAHRHQRIIAIQFESEPAEVTTLKYLSQSIIRCGVLHCKADKISSAVQNYTTRAQKSTSPSIWNTIISRFIWVITFIVILRRN